MGACRQVLREKFSFLVVGVALGLLASCGGESGDSNDAIESTASTSDESLTPSSTVPATSSTLTATSSTAAVGTGEPEDEPVVWEPGVGADLPSGPVTLPLWGGVSMELPEGTFVSIEGNTFDANASCIFFDMPPGGGRPTGQVVIAHVYGAADETPATGTSIEEMLTQYPAEARPAATGETIEVLGVGLERYVLSADTPWTPEGGGFGCAPEGELNYLYFHPSRFGAMYMGEWDGGVLVLAAFGVEQADADISIAFLDALLPTVTGAD